MLNSNEVSFTTNQLEELWTELIQVWPAVKKNPEIVNKIEHLWNILKNSNNAQIDINQEIKKHLGNSNTSTAFEASHAGSLNNNVTVTASDSAKTTSTSTQDNEDIDSLLSEILGENNIEDATNISGTEEIDRLIASVLGEDWLQEETSVQPFPEKQPVTDSSSNLNFDTDSNIDELVTSILNDDVDENTIKPATAEIDFKSPNIADDKITIDKLLNDILAEDNEDESLTTDNNRADKKSKAIIKEDINKENEKISYNINIGHDEDRLKDQETSATEKEDIDELINEIINKDDEPEITTYNINSTTEIQNKTTRTTEKEDIDELINEIINKDDEPEITTYNINSTTEEQNTTAALSSEENIDNLINDIISNDDADIEDTNPELNKSDDQLKTQTTSSTEKEDIDELINEIINKDDEPEITTYNINSTTEEQNTTAALNSEENIDNLINDIISNDDADIEDTNPELNKSDDQLKTQTTSSTEKEDIDELINEIMVKDIGSENIAHNINNTTNESQNKTTESNPKKDIDVLIQSVSDNKTDDNIEKNKLNAPKKITMTPGVTPYQKETTRTTPEKTTPRENRNIPEITTKKESSNTLLTVTLLILVLSFIGVWMLFFNNEEIILADKSIDSKIEKESPVIKEITDEKYQHDTKPANSTPKVEGSTAYIEPDYTTKIETNNNNDITITLNTPETALDTEIKPNKNTAIATIESIADDNFEKLEKISESKRPVEKLGENEEIIEQAKKVTPFKTKSKRKVFTHKIVKGDTLWAIAKRYVNNPYRYSELAKLSKIKNPDRIYPGNTVTIIIYTK